jgi:hypothetical protein
LPSRRSTAEQNSFRSVVVSMINPPGVAAIMTKLPGAARGAAREALA